MPVYQFKYESDRPGSPFIHYLMAADDEDAMQKKDAYMASINGTYIPWSMRFQKRSGSWESVSEFRPDPALRSDIKKIWQSVGKEKTA